MTAFDQTLIEYGADLENLRRFDDESPDLLPYACLVGARQKGGTDNLLPLLGVYEWQDTPLVYLVDASFLHDENQFRSIRRHVALRGDAPYLGVVAPGSLTLHRIGLDAASRAHSRLAEGADVSARATFARLGNQRPGLTGKERWIGDVVLRLLGDSLAALLERATVSPPDAISLVGRALFTRFLADRGLLPQELLAGRSPEQLFDDARQAEVTCRWLDDTFNGDLLPYSPGLLGRLSPVAFAELGNIQRHAPGGQRYLEWSEDWAHLDFAHIPVGVLSQAYEHYQRRHTPDEQHREGGFYTPRPIADLMVRGAFHALRRDGHAHRARVLDPAAGAGVFLLTAFRHLVAERWRHDRTRPDTKTLREILYEQVAGFDINEAGLRFAALGLYLLSIELDPHPEPVHKLGFEKLRDRVLFNLGERDQLGSLGNAVGDEHAGRYDLVIGNPPWASATQLAEWPEVIQKVKEIAARRLPKDGPAPRLPNEGLDLPFVWRAMEWAKPGGQIAFALHGRLLFQQGDGMPEARAALFGALDVTGIVNGADLRQSKVWPEIDAPFCLLYARNDVPAPGAGFRFVSPHLEHGLNGAGGLRLDAGNAEIVSAQQVAQRPEILKVLFRGGPLGLEVYDRIAARELETLKSYWTQRFGAEGRGLRCAGNGYQKLRPSSRVRKNGDGLPGVLAAYLVDLPELNAEASKEIRVDTASLNGFAMRRIHDPRPREIFRGPLLIVHQSPPAEAGRIRVAVADGDVVFNETYYGYSAHEHPDGARLVRYLALLIGSKPAFWHALMTSGKFGFEREVVEKAIIETIAVPSFEQLPTATREQIVPLFDAVASRNGEAAWADVDAWVAQLYGLRPRDLEVIEDTLRYELPFAAHRKAAQMPPSAAEREHFRAALDAELQPWARRFDKPLAVTLLDPPGGSPWGLLRIDIAQNPATAPADDWPEILRLADRLAGSEVLLAEADGRLWVARLAQARYWSRSAARLLARRIVWEQADGLFGSAAA